MENRYNKTNLAAENEADKEKWFEALVDIIDENSAPNLFQRSKTLKVSKPEKKEDKEEDSISSAPKVDYDVIEMKVWFQIKEVKLTVYPGDTLDQRLIELDTKNLKVDFQKQPGKTTVNLKLESLDINDYMFTFTNPNLKKLATSLPPIESQLENADLIEVHVVILEQEHPKYNETMTNNHVVAKFGYLYVNFKPEIVGAAMRFFLPPPEGVDESHKPIERKKTSEVTVKKEETTYKESITNTLLNLQIELKEVGLRLVHMKTHVCMAELALKDTRLKLTQKPYLTEFQGVIGNIQLFDTTNYPHTIDSNVEYEKINKYELVGVGEPTENLLEVSFKLYEPEHPEADRKTNTYIFVDVKMGSVRVNYVQKPVLRLVDYVTGQVVPSVSPPEGALPAKEEKENTQIVTHVSEESAERTLKKLNFMSLKVYVGSPVVILRPVPDSVEYWEVKLGDVSVQNSVHQDKVRFSNPSKPLEHVYCQTFEVKLQNMGIFRYEEQDRIRLTREVNFDLSVDLPMFVPEYKALYDKKGVVGQDDKFFIDERIAVRGKMTPLIAIFSHNDFISLMKILNYNITYDDGMDKMFQSAPPPKSPNKEQEQGVSQSQVMAQSQNQDKPPSPPVVVNLTFENFTLLALDRGGLPFSMINLHLLHIDVFVDEKGAMYGSIKAYELNGSYFERTETSLTEKKMLGALDRVTEHQIDNKKRDTVIEEIVTSLKEYAEDLSNTFSLSETQKNVQLSVDLDFQPAGKKTIRVNIHGLKAFLVPDIYIHLIKFIEMDESVNPPEKSKESEKEEDRASVSTKDESPKKSSAAPVKEGSIRVEIDIKDILITVPASKLSINSNPHVLALKGDVLCSFDGYAAPTLEESLTGIMGNNYFRATEQCTDHNKVMHVKASLSQFELFICEFEELLKAKDFSQVRRRNMILPFTLTFTRNGHLVPNKLRNGLISVAKNEAFIELMVLRMSYQDALLINNTIYYQLEQLGNVSKDSLPKKSETKSRNESLVESEIDAGSTKVSHQDLGTAHDLEGLRDDLDGNIEIIDVQGEMENKDNWAPNQEEFSLGSQGIQIVLINDAEGTLVPVMEFTMQEVVGTVNMINKKVILSTRASINCSYFNPLPSKWEPIIEKFGLEVGLMVEENPKLTVVVSMDDTSENININVSEEMLATLYSTMMTWKSDYERKAVKKDQDKLARVAITGYGNEEQTGVQVEDELIDYVSPYIIINQTGYPIEVRTDTTTMRKGQQHVRDNFGYRSKKLQNLTNRVYTIPQDGRAQYLVESNIEDLFKKSMMEESMAGMNHISVKIMHPNFTMKPVLGIDIDKAIVSDYKLEGTTVEGKTLTHDKFRLYTDIRLDKSTKVITLSSPYRITNRTQMAYSLQLEGNAKNIEIFLEPGSSSSIPVDFIDGTLCVKAGGTDVPSLKRPLHDFITKDLEIVELQAGPTFVLLESVKKDVVADFYEISIRPTFSVKNCCGLELQYRITADADEDPDVRKLKPQEMMHEVNISTKHQVFLQLRTQGFYWSHKFPIHAGKSKIKVETEIPIKDATGNSISIFLFYPEEEIGTRKFLLYTKACIVNETPYDLKYYVPMEHQKVLLPGQIPTDADLVLFNPNLTLINETQHLMISRKSHHEHSEVLDVGTVGSISAELKEERGTSMLELGLDMALVQSDKEYKLMTKIITINPRYVLVNKTSQSIEVKREKGLNQPHVLKPNQREPLQWSEWGSLVKEKNIVIRVQDTENQDLWGWSNGFDASQVGSYEFVAKSANKSQVKFFKATVTLENSMQFIVFEEEKPEKAALKIKNDCPGLYVKVYQEGASPFEATIIKPDTVIPWSWDFPNKKTSLFIDFSTEENGQYLCGVQGVTFEELNHVQRVLMPGSIKEQLSKVYYVVTMEDNSRVLTFLTPEKGKSPSRKKAANIIEEAEKEAKAEDRRIFNMNLEVNINGIGISVISNLKNKDTKRKERKEVMYLLVKGLEFKLLDSKENMTAQLRLKYLNLDNNATLDTSFPVLITPTKPMELMPNTRNYFLDVLISQKKSTEIKYFETIQLLLTEVTIKADGMFLDSVLEVGNNFSEIFKDKNYFSANRSIAESLYANTEEAHRLEDPEYFKSKFQWIKKPIPEMTSNIFIRNMVVHPIFVNVSFQLKRRDIADNIFFLLKLFATAVGSAIANLDNAAIKLKGFRLDNVFDSQEAITKQILDKIKGDATKSVLKALGSLDIMGNPVGFFRDVKTGVVDLIDKPIEGFLQGPLEGGKGIIKGAGSFLKNTVSGAFNSIGKFTGSLASGMSNLSMDDEYLAKRERAKLKRPDHVGQGIYQGFSSLAKGVGYGVSGVITKPIEGAAKGGVSGLVKGTAKGVAGLFVKPVTGVLDAASKTAEGVKNTTKLFDQKPNDDRLRYPRAFYGREKFYRTYIDTDAEMIWLLHHLKDTKYRDISLINAYDVFPDDRDKETYYILALSYEYVLCWDARRENLAWVFNPRDIVKVNLFQNGLQVELLRADEITEEREVSLLNCDSEQNEYLGQKLIQLKRQVEQRK